MTFFPRWLTEGPLVPGPAYWDSTSAGHSGEGEKVVDWGLQSSPVLSACPAAAAHKTMHTNAICKVELGNLDFRLLHKQITGTWGFLFLLVPLSAASDGGGFAVE